MAQPPRPPKKEGPTALPRRCGGPLGEVFGAAVLDEALLGFPIPVTALLPGVVVHAFGKDGHTPKRRVLGALLQHLGVPRRYHLVLLSGQEEQWNLDLADPLRGLPPQPQEAVLQALESNDREERVNHCANGEEGVLQDDAAGRCLRLTALLHRACERHRDGSAQRPPKDEDALRVDPPGLTSGLQPLPRAEGVLDESILRGRTLTMAIAPVV
mmetsp:Transcript_13564/g.37302  ORF Transcript_13564/g.37302 Transcript_13564/m.37302 type:complete len:213 (+) Transcript_13564:78-716(+)